MNRACLLVVALATAGNTLAAGQWSSAPTTSQWSSDYRVPRPNAAPAAPARDPVSATPAECRAGQRLEIRYVGAWFKGHILGGPDAQGRCQVRYDGRSSAYDEWVGSERMRPLNEVATEAPASPGPGAPATAGVPGGRYACYTFDAGQLNYTYTDVMVHDGRQYAVGKQGGRYTLGADGRMTFTGPMANAEGRYSVKGGGTPEILLVFNGDNRASMTCSRAR